MGSDTVNERKSICDIFDELLGCGVNRESQSRFASPNIQLQKIGGSQRKCVDYSGLSNILLKHVKLPTSTTGLTV